MAHLEVLEGPPGLTRFVLDHDVVLGRSADNPICLPDHRVSRRHARLRRQGATFVIEDLNSTNGVLVQGERIPAGTPHTLHDQDEIRICSTRFRFHADPPDAVPADPTRTASQQDALTTTGVSIEGTFGTLSLTLLGQDAVQPKVAVALDASTSMADVDEGEKQTGKGLQDALKRLQTICQVSTALGTITNRDQLLHRILDCLFEIFPRAERAFIMLRDKEQGTLVPVVAKKRQDSPGQREEVAISHTIVNEVIAHKRSVLSFDALDDERFHRQASIINLAIRSMMCAPLLVGAEILGLIQVDTSTGLSSFTPEDLHVLTGISAQAAIAIKNMQLYEALEVETARRTSLARYFSPRLVELLMAGDLPTALGGNAYQGIVLFADIIGFTAMSEAMPPAQVMARLNRYFKVMQKLIYDHGGNVDKVSGDGLMAFWGVPDTAGHDVHDAVLTALRMQGHLWVFNLALTAENQPPIHMGIGLNSGEFVAGNIGSEDKIEFTVIGDTVNLAARIEGLAGRTQVLVSEATWSLIKSVACAVQLPPVRLKGKSRPETIYSVRAIQDPTDGRYVLAMPCQLLDATTRPVGQGVITSTTGVGKDLQLVLRTDTPLPLDGRLHLRLAMAEYHKSLTFSATVIASTQVSHTGTPAYTKGVLTDLDDEAAMAFFMPGCCLVTNHSWNELRRT